MVTIIAGPNSASVPAGRTVGAYRADFAEAFNLTADTSAVLNGQGASDFETAPEGSKLVFTTAVGQKG